MDVLITKIKQQKSCKPQIRKLCFGGTGELMPKLLKPGTGMPVLRGIFEFHAHNSGLIKSSVTVRSEFVQLEPMNQLAVQIHQIGSAGALKNEEPCGAVKRIFDIENGITVLEQKGSLLPYLINNNGLDAKDAIQLDEHLRAQKAATGILPNSRISLMVDQAATAVLDGPAALEELLDSGQACPIQLDEQ